MAFSSTVGDRKVEGISFSGSQTHELGGFPNTGAYFPLSFGDTAPLAPPDARSTLQRRFTAESMKSGMTGRGSFEPSTLQRSSMSESLDLAPSSLQKFQAITKENEKIQEEKRRMQEQLERMEFQERQNEMEIRRIAQELTQPAQASTAPVAEPSTPPEFKETITYSDRRIRPGFMPNSVLATPTSVSRHEAVAQQLMTPPADDILPLFGQSKTPSKSGSGSRRNSGENDNLGMPEEQSLGQRLAAVRLSNAMSPLANAPQSPEVHGPMKNIFLGNEAGGGNVNQSPAVAGAASPGVKGYLQMNSTDDKFPILVRRDSYPNLLSASSAALDLAVQKTMPDASQSAWNSPSFSRHRPSQHSLPVNNYTFSPGNNVSAGINMLQSDAHHMQRARFERGSVELSVGHLDSHKPTASESVIMPKLQSSFSTPDIPTLRQNNNNPIMRGMHTDASRRVMMTSFDNPVGTHAGPVFGPPLPSNMPTMHHNMTPPGVTPIPSPGLYAPYGTMTNNAAPQYYNPSQFSSYSSHAGSRAGDSVPSRAGFKRVAHDADTNRYAATDLTDHINEIYSLCKDQHGCRYLQKKLEEKNPQYVQIIFQETQGHVVELMTDPFGNYLCQKLLEYASDDQRTVLVNNAAPQLVKIALNQHGTRALQKMIEYLSTPAQVQTIVNALKSKVVELIQDLNGNHVIQKCLNRLSAEDSQFIFDAVGEHCVPVGTHRHGCCVLQRCIDHASGSQKAQLVSQITANAFNLVQDPFGNYVVQYILDQEDSELSSQLIGRFAGSVCQLSKQKFSSNVIEKCIRVAEPHLKRQLIEEMSVPAELEKLVRDCYANYVVQTALDYADPETRQRMVDNLRPILPAIRMTPYGRRIQSKIQLNGAQPFSTFGGGVSSRMPMGHSRGVSYGPPGSLRASGTMSYSSSNYQSNDLGPAFNYA